MSVLIQVLLIEDNPADVLLLSDSLAHDLAVQFAPVSVERLSDGIAMLNSRPFDVVLLDLGLPDSQGLETFNKLHAAFPLLPIIVVSGFSDEAAAIEAVQAGAQDYLVKGFATLDWVGRVIRYSIERQQTQLRLQTALIEKETLLRELYHRTMNNMQLISAMLAMEANSIGDRRYIQVFNDLSNRIQAMALVHQNLYRSKNLSSINPGEYMVDLIAYLRQNHPDCSERVELKLNIGNFPLVLDAALPCGLLICELVSNALVHAFPPGRAGHIWIDFHQEDDDAIQLSVADDGVGVSQEFNPRQDGRVGLTNVVALGEYQLKGQVEFKTGDGFACYIRFPNQFNRAHV